MELNEALKVVVELAEQNMLNDADMPQEMLQQYNAIETVRLFLQELESPSPLKVVIQHSVMHDYLKAVVNVPATVSYVFGNMVPKHLPVTVDPSYDFDDPQDN